MNTSDSESDEFESADEGLSEQELHISENKEFIDDEVNKNISSQNSEDKTIDNTTPVYRKRPNNSKQNCKVEVDKESNSNKGLATTHQGSNPVSGQKELKTPQRNLVVNDSAEGIFDDSFNTLGITATSCLLVDKTQMILRDNSFEVNDISEADVTKDDDILKESVTDIDIQKINDTEVNIPKVDDTENDDTRKVGVTDFDIPKMNVTKNEDILKESVTDADVSVSNENEIDITNDLDPAEVNIPKESLPENDILKVNVTSNCDITKEYYTQNEKLVETETFDNESSKLQVMNSVEISDEEEEATSTRSLIEVLAHQTITKKEMDLTDRSAEAENHLFNLESDHKENELDIDELTKREIGFLTKEKVIPDILSKPVEVEARIENLRQHFVNEEKLEHNEEKITLHNDDDNLKKSLNLKAQGNDGWDEWEDDWEEEQKQEDRESWNNDINVENMNIISETLLKKSEPKELERDGWDDWGDDEPGNAQETIDEKQILENNSLQLGLKASSNEHDNSWSWGSWGVNSFISTATAVSQGISTVLESGLGVPNPETLASQQKAMEENSQNMDKNILKSLDGKENEETTPLSFVIPNLATFVPVVSQLTKIVDSTKVQEISSKVISGGLDTLENIGKKTMEVLQEGDPGLKKKKAILTGEQNKPILSQILREAKEKAEIKDKRLEEERMTRKCQFEWLFDDFQGLVHLEALEMLSKQCELKLEDYKNNLTNEALQDFLNTLDEVKQICDIEDDDENVQYTNFKTKLTESLESMREQIIIEKILNIHDDMESWLQNKDNHANILIVQQKAISTLAELTAATVQQFHKVGELLLVKKARKTVEEADTLLQLTQILCTEINNLSTRFASILFMSGDSENVKAIVTKLYIETENACSYIKQAFALLVPVVQLGVI